VNRVRLGNSSPTADPIDLLGSAPGTYSAGWVSRFSAASSGRGHPQHLAAIGKAAGQALLGRSPIRQRDERGRVGRFFLPLSAQTLVSRLADPAAASHTCAATVAAGLPAVRGVFFSRLCTAIAATTQAAARPSRPVPMSMGQGLLRPDSARELPPAYRRQSIGSAVGDVAPSGRAGRFQGSKVSSSDKGSLQPSRASVGGHQQQPGDAGHPR